MFNLRRVLALFSAQPRTPYDAALADLAHGRAAQALAALDELLRGARDPQERARIANKRGVALIELGDRERAYGAFEEALSYVAEFAPALVNLGNVEFEAGRLDEAAALYRRAIESDREYAPAHRHLALVYKRQRRSADAFAEFSRARRLEGRMGRKQRK